MLAMLYCVTSADKTKLNEIYFRVTCAFKLVAIWPIALIGRLRFLFLSLIFWIRICAKAYFCLASPPPFPSPSLAPPPYVPAPPSLWNCYSWTYIFTQTSNTRWKWNKRQSVCSQRVERLSEKVVFPSNNNQNTWRHFVELLFTENFKSLIYQGKILSSKAFLFAKNQTLNKTLRPKIHRPTKNIHNYGDP